MASRQRVEGNIGFFHCLMNTGKECLSLKSILCKFSMQSTYINNFFISFQQIETKTLPIIAIKRSKHMEVRLYS